VEGRDHSPVGCPIRIDIVVARQPRAALAPGRRAIEAPPAQDRVWLHGDLHPRNLVVRDGALAGILDWGDITAGDVATDLAVAWLVFDSVGQDAFLEAYGPTEAEGCRALGWAVNFGSALLDGGESRHVRMGESIIREITGPRPPLRSGSDPRHSNEPEESHGG